MNLQPLVSNAPVIVYIDIKSPYAYLAVEPTRELERELRTIRRELDGLDLAV